MTRNGSFSYSRVKTSRYQRLLRNYRSKYNGPVTGTISSVGSFVTADYLLISDLKQRSGKYPRNLSSGFFFSSGISLQPYFSRISIISALASPIVDPWAGEDDSVTLPGGMGLLFMENAQRSSSFFPLSENWLFIGQDRGVDGNRSIRYLNLVWNHGVIA